MCEANEGTISADAITKINHFAELVQAHAAEIETDFAERPKYGTAFKKMFYGAMAALFFDINDGKLSLRQAEERKAIIALMKLGKTYSEEMVKCSDADAKLSALAMACCVLETLLMISCICYKQQVSATKPWQRAWKKAKRVSYVQVLQDRNVTLSTLIEIGQELRWFSNAIPEEFTKELTVDELNMLNSEVPENASAVFIAPSRAKDMRNMMHPGKCLRESRDFDKDDSLQMGLMFMALTLCAFILRHAE